MSNEFVYCLLFYYYGEVEIGGFVFEGKVCIYFGENFVDYYDMGEGDWVFVLLFMLYIECNVDCNWLLYWLIVCIFENIVVNFDDVFDELLWDWFDCV